eukprot:symbB.v1.2.030096.t1/scaffold3350.1/size58636/2
MRAVQYRVVGTYSQVTSAHRSDSSKRLRRIEDADPNSRSSGAPGSPRSRVARSSSSQRSDKRRTVKKSGKSRGSGGSPGGRSRPSNADEELERMIADMRGQSDQLRDQILRLEDEKRQELMLYDSKMQSAKNECQEFNQQYNHVLDCWTKAEERSRTFEMELRSEIGLFHEASQAIAEKDSQQSQEREMITDEAMVLKRRNETLIYELGQSQHDVIQATQYAQVEHWSLDLFKTRMIEEENSIRNLSGELTVAQSYFNLEKSRAERLQESMEEDRDKYERHLSLIMSNPAVRNQGANTVDVASRIEIQNLRQELIAAQNTIAIPNQSSTSNNTAEEEQLVSRLKEVELQNEEMKEQGSFEFWRKKHREARDAQDDAERRFRDARDEAREERDMFAREENGARKRGEDVDRLRMERNEWREYYDELTAGWTEEESTTEEAHEVRSTISEAAVSAIAYNTSKISRKEAIPNWPKIHELEFWKSQVTSSIVAASGDLDHEAWIAWIAPTFKMSPDINGELASSGDNGFNSIGCEACQCIDGDDAERR